MSSTYEGVADREPRVTPQTARVFDCLIGELGLSGVEIGKRARLSSGTLFPLLIRLEDAGWVSSKWEAGDPRQLGRPRRRYYSVTGLGLARMRAAAAGQLAVFSRLASA